uniref:ShKT domain-containing protein n=1 Tax=Parascaris univalens TaxID=6257 RepID=A0A915BD14_PARUN
SLTIAVFLNAALTVKSGRGPYKVYRIIPKTLQHMNVLKWLRDSAPDYEFDIWKDAGRIGDFADVMVPPSMHRIVEDLFTGENLTFAITIPDVMKLMRRIELEPYSVTQDGGSQKAGKDLLLSSNARLKDDPILDEEADQRAESQNKIGLLKAKYRFGDYGSYKEMIKFMRTIEFYYPNFTKIIRIGMTHEGSPIEGLKIGYPVTDTEKRAFWIDGNIHAREWASSHTALFFINQLVSGYGSNDRITEFINEINIFIFPCLNPDGYEYTRSEPSPQVRLWRKNRSPQKCVRSLWGGRRCCEGVDLNRNFDFHWSETGSSTNPCSNLYQGEKVFSEPESRAVRDFLMSKEMKNKLDAFITLHTYAQLWIHPYSHETETYPMDYIELKRTAKRAIDKLKSVYGTQYKIGTGADTLAPASGGSDDWAKGVLGVKYVYLVELRPELELSNGFILNKYELIPTAVETWEAVQVVMTSVLRAKRLSEGDSRLPSLFMRKQLYRQRAMQEDHELLYKSQPMARQLDVTLQTRHSGVTVQQAVLDSHQPSARHDQIGSAESFVKFKNGSTTVFRNGNNLKASVKPQIEKEEISFSNIARPLNFAATNTTNISLNNHQTNANRHQSKSSAISARAVPESFANPNCRDMRYSCGFWLKSNKNVCIEQQQFMRLQCAFTCRFCTS